LPVVFNKKEFLLHTALEILAMLIPVIVMASKVNVLVKIYWWAINIATLLTYFVDKSRAIRNEYRIPENKLHAMCLLGGFSGACLGRMLARHKIRKVSFTIVLVIGFVETMMVCAVLQKM
jgi:uncharacterized membrane protein YsdA (DUF1294 family)